MVCRFRTLLVGELPASVDPSIALRSGIDGVIVTESSSVVAEQSYPYALLGPPSNIGSSGKKHLQSEGVPLTFAPDDRRLAAAVDLGGLLFDPMRQAVRQGLEQVIAEMIASSRQNGLLIVKNWDGSHLAAIDYGLMDGAVSLPPKPPRSIYPPPAVH
jgi:hypothetical protein